MLSFKQKCNLDKDYKEIVEKMNDIYIKLLKVNPDDYKNDLVVADFIDQIREIAEDNDFDNTFESDDPNTTDDDVYTIIQVLKAINEILVQYYELNESLKQTSEITNEVETFKNMKQLLIPYSK